MLAPLWPDNVSVNVSCDGSSPTFIDLRDYSVPLNKNGQETQNYAALYSCQFSPLFQNYHSLTITKGRLSDVAIVDGFMCVQSYHFCSNSSVLNFSQTE